MKYSEGYGISLATAAFGACLAAAVAAPASAQTAYPERNVKFVVAFAPGGPTDVAARIVAEAIGAKWGKTIVIENRGGAGGNIAAGAVSRADPDGYTALVTTSSLAVNLSLRANPGFTAESLRPVAFVATTPNIILANNNVPAKDLKELIALARKEKYGFATAGTGTTPHLSAERIFNLIGKAGLAQVPYKGAGPAMNDIVAGHVKLAVVAMTPAVPLVKSGKMKAFAVTSAKRTPALPDVPTVAETGIAKIDDQTWVAIFLPAKTPDAIAARINEATNQVLADPAVAKRIQAAGLEPMGGKLADARSFLNAEIKSWAEVISAIGLRTDKK
ncbi:MAG: Bug family tripartite tricarboxylate transporter substrate binding protein [Beijerinckiaceae bacterium]